MDHILTYMTFIPLLGAVIVLCLPSDADGADQVGGGGGDGPAAAAGDLALRQLRPHGRRLSVHGAGAVDPELQHPVPRRRRRRQHHHGAAHGAALLPLHLRVVGHRQGREGLLRALPAARHRHDGRLRRARLLPLLRLLGGHAAADVLPHRHLGRPAARVRGDQVLPLHAARQRRSCCSRSSRFYFNVTDPATGQPPSTCWR